MNSEIKILFATIPTDDSWVAELYCDHVQWAEISQKPNGLHITIFPSSLNSSKTFRFEEFKDALKKVEKAFSKPLLQE